MASRRQLKKEIKQAVIILADECLFHYHIAKTIDATALDTLFGRIIETSAEYIRRINNPEGTKNLSRTRKYYRALIEDFNKNISAIFDELCAACKQV